MPKVELSKGCYDTGPAKEMQKPSTFSRRAAKDFDALNTHINNLNGRRVGMLDHDWLRCVRGAHSLAGELAHQQAVGVSCRKDHCCASAGAWPAS